MNAYHSIKQWLLSRECGKIIFCAIDLKFREIGFELIENNAFLLLDLIYELKFEKIKLL